MAARGWLQRGDGAAEGGDEEAELSCRQVPVSFMQYSPKLHEIRPPAQLQVAGKILRFIQQGLWIQQNEQNRVYWVVC